MNRQKDFDQLQRDLYGWLGENQLNDLKKSYHQKMAARHAGRLQRAKEQIRSNQAKANLYSAKRIYHQERSQRDDTSR